MVWTSLIETIAATTPSPPDAHLMFLTDLALSGELFKDLGLPRPSWKQLRSLIPPRTRHHDS
ncbi:hypothetical protein [Amycolatopsis jejuensis]|uniref:hypothetical protein n=1 Tax=Amycolatopsis jejuensis TaxID=330084 RepID=UPI000524EF50|nr:hypothetical protein [Amycolatopsis jejuensis]